MQKVSCVGAQRRVERDIRNDTSDEGNEWGSGGNSGLSEAYNLNVIKGQSVERMMTDSQVWRSEGQGSAGDPLGLTAQPGPDEIVKPNGDLLPHFHMAAIPAPHWASI